MTDTETATRINQVGTVFVPVADQDRALARDQAYCAFATTEIEADHAALRSGGVEVDAKIARTGKRRSGLVSTDVSIGDPVPAQFFFRDPDGNRFLVVQPD